MKSAVKKALLLFLSFCLVLTFSFSAYGTEKEEKTLENDEKAKIEYENYLSSRKDIFKTSSYLSNGLLYTENDFETNGAAQKSFTFELDLHSGTLPVVSYGEYLYGADRLKTMVSQLSDEGKRVVGAVNGDFYSTSTGVPMSVMIKDGRLISSDDGKYFVGFDEENNVSILKNPITIDILKEDKVISVDHFNKYPTIYALYLLDDSFSSATKSKLSGIEYVFMPYIKNVEEAEIDAFDAEQTQDSQNEQVMQEETAEPQDTEEPQDKEEPQETESESDEIPIPSVEVLENGVIIGENFYEKADVYAKADCELALVLYEIRKSSVDAPIPEGCFVLVADEHQKHRTEGLEIGDELTLKISSGQVLENTKNAIGNGGLIVKDGQYYIEFEESHYNSRNPRTALGMREDGTLIIYCVDGRQNTYSLGLTAKQLAYEMIRLGCVTAVNLDGGGSTTVYVANAGEQNASLVNAPSDISERKIANSLLFVNASESTNEISKLFLYPQNPIVMSSGGVFGFDKLLATDENYFPISLEQEEDINFDVKFEETGKVYGGLFLSSQFEGLVPVVSSVTTENGTESFDAGNIITVGKDFVDKCELSFYEIKAKPFQRLNISVLGKLKNYPVYMGTGNLLWYIEDDYMPWDIYEEKFLDLINNVYQYTAEEFLEKSQQLTGKHIIPDEEKLVCPTFDNAISSDYVSIDAFGNIDLKTDGKTLYLLAYFNNEPMRVIIDIMEFPFADSKEHWARSYLYDAFEMGLMNGETQGEQRYFFPEREMTNAEFLTVLSRILGVKASQDFQSSFDDATDIPEWAIEHVFALEENGYLDTVLAQRSTLLPLQKISRLEVMKILGSLCEDTAKDLVSDFSDASNIAKQDLQYVNNSIAAGLISGYEDGTLRPDHTLTRAQAATVLLRLAEYMKNMEN